MSIPDFQTIMLPLLEFSADDREHSKAEAVEHLAAKFGLTEEERKTLLPSGRQRVFDNRVGWARTYMVKAGLLESMRRGFWRITAQGQQVLTHRPPRIDIKYLGQFAKFREFRDKRRESRHQAEESPAAEQGFDAGATPEEALEAAYQRLRQDLADELLEMVRKCSPSFFERLVVDLLVKMGYGGTRQDAGQAIGRSGDEGIDGIIKEDRLGLDAIYLQAKRWDGVVGRPEVQKFAGALQGHRARKGVFITTSSFSKEAEDYVARIDSRIILIDGQQLVRLMIDHDVGVSTAASYEIKRIDQDYFMET